MNSTNINEKELSPEQKEELFRLLEVRFKKNMQRHGDIEWSKVLSRLEANLVKIWSLYEMERTGGEPDVVGVDATTSEFIFFDCSAETPGGRRNVCYDHEALLARKKFPPEESALHMAEKMGIELLTEDQYRTLQKLGKFDLKTSSWLQTSVQIRKLGGAIFGDRRYNTVFVYHNGADSYYGARGFRGSLRI